MTDDEIAKYLETIKPFYTEEMQAYLAPFRDELDEIQEETKRLNLLCFTSPPIGVIDQATWDRERGRKNTIWAHQRELQEAVDDIHRKRKAAHFLAEKEGVIHEERRVAAMPTTEINDIQRKAEILNILENRALQLDKVYRLVRTSDISKGYSLSFGYIADLRGPWEDAVDAVHLSTISDEEIPQQEPDIGSPEWRTLNARRAADLRHDQPGGSREKQAQMRAIWASGGYTSRDRCAEEECAALGMSFSAARKALRNTPNP